MSTVQPDSTAPLRTARSWSEEFVQSTAFEILSRAGFVARALVYGIIGLLAFDLARSRTSRVRSARSSSSPSVTSCSRFWRSDSAATRSGACSGPSSATEPREPTAEWSA